MSARGRFRRDRHGRFRPGLVALEQELLSPLPRQAQNLLEQRGPFGAARLPRRLPR